MQFLENGFNFLFGMAQLMQQILVVFQKLFQFRTLIAIMSDGY